MSSKQLKFIVVGAGQRGICYAEPVVNATSAKIHAVAEPIEFRRKFFGREFIWGTEGSPQEGQEFSDWKDWLAWETDRRRRQADGKVVPDGVDGAFVCTLDESHVEIMCAIAPLNLHILCEKPLATSLADCLSIYRALQPPGCTPEQQTKVFSIGHVLRYSPHNLQLRKLLLTDRVIGDILSIEHVEPVGWTHFAHSYTRGNWRRETKNGDGSLLTKCSHDMDLLLWLLSYPPPDVPLDHATAQMHLPRLISSMGSRSQFRRSRKPAAAGTATNCVSCPIERECQYSAVRIYDDDRLAKGDTHWLEHIVHDIEDLVKVTNTETIRTTLRKKLSEDYDRSTATDDEIASRSWYGRCVYESDNTVCDDQVVTISWDEDTEMVPPRPWKRAMLHMIANTEKECRRRGVVYGSMGELSYDSDRITYFNFLTQKTTVIDAPKPPVQERNSHSGGDYGLAIAFINAVEAVENQGMHAREAQGRYIGCTLDDAIRGHAMVFAAEEARREEKVVKWQDWWTEKTRVI
jgi:predicted dehydrogenase